MPWILRLVVVLSCFVAVGARAGETEDAVGKMHFDAGDRAYKEGRYQKALAEFRAGYELTHRPPFLINIAQSYKKLNDLQKAREFYKTYLYLEPNSPLVPKVQKWLVEIDQEIGSAAPTPSASPAPSPSPGPTVTPESPPVANTTAPPMKPAKRRVVTWVGVGLTAAVLVAAVGVEVAGKLAYDDLVKTCAPHCEASRVSSLETDSMLPPDSSSPPVCSVQRRSSPRSWRRAQSIGHNVSRRRFRLRAAASASNSNTRVARLSGSIRRCLQPRRLAGVPRARRAQGPDRISWCHRERWIAFQCALSGHGAWRSFF